MQGITNTTLPNTLEGLKARQDPAAVKTVAKEMEALFANELLKVMRESSSMGKKSSFGGDVYMSMFDQQLSRIFAERGIGIKESLEKSLASLAAKQASSREKTPELPTVPGSLPSPQASGETQPLSMSEEIQSILPDIPMPRVSSGYGMRTDPFSGGQRFHHGIDLPAPSGTPVHALLGGTVVFSGEQPGYGNVIVIDNGNGYQTKYAHNRENLVQVGDTVSAGAAIAQVGSTGRSTGPHVHFEVTRNGKDVNPKSVPASILG